MKIKVFKYIKLIVLAMLICSMVSPSFAALSSSDGSAFVTKGEFDSAISDFNSRLTTFEAGINSKIDSQVTAYLDRNGIWSGKDQTLTATDLWFWQCVSDYKNKRVGVFYFPIVNTENNNFACSVAYNTANYGANVNGIYDFIDTEDQSTILVENFSKSGMMVIDYNWRTLYYTDNHTPTDSANNIQNGVGGRDGKNSYFWAGNYFQDIKNNKQKDLLTYEDTRVNWSGFYFACTDGGDSWTNLNYKHDLKLDVIGRDGVERVGTVENIGNMLIQASSKGQVQKKSVGINDTTMWGAPWADPRGRRISKFFVSKGEKLKIISHIGRSGYSMDQFKSRQQSAMMWAFMQVKNLKVY